RSAEDPEIRALRDGLRSADRVPAGVTAPGTHLRIGGTERQRLRGRPVEVLGSDQAVLARPNARESPCADLLVDARGDQVPVPERGPGSLALGSDALDAGPLPTRSSRQRP